MFYNTYICINFVRILGEGSLTRHKLSINYISFCFVNSFKRDFPHNLIDSYYSVICLVLFSNYFKNTTTTTTTTTN